LKKLLNKLGMVRLIDTLKDENNKNGYVELQLDGRILGYVDVDEAKMFSDVLRKLKCKDITADELKISKKYLNVLPADTEVVYIPKKSTKSYL